MDFWDLTIAKHAYNGFKKHVEPQVADWLYGDWDEQKYKQYMALNAIPGVGNYFDYLLDLRADQEYFSRYGMSYSDIHDPRKLRSTNSGTRLIGSAANAVNMVSKNIEDLYS